MKFLIPATAIFASTALAADSSVADPVQWYSLSCKSDDNGAVDKLTMDAVCEKLGGEPCEQSCTLSGEPCVQSCTLSGKRSADEENRAKWTSSCGLNSIGDDQIAEIFVQKDEESAKSLC
jgi:hypothetical protein